MPNKTEPENAILIEVYSPQTNTAFIAFNNTLWGTVFNAAKKLDRVITSSLTDKNTTAMEREDVDTLTYRLGDLRYFVNKVESVAFTPINEFRFFEAQSFQSSICEFRWVYSTIKQLLDSRNFNPKLRELLPHVGFPIRQFNRCKMLCPDPRWNSKTTNSTVKISISNLTNASEFGQVKLEAGPDIIRQIHNAITSIRFIRNPELENIINVLNHIEELGGLYYYDSAKALEQMIVENLELISKLRPGVPIRPELAKKVLLRGLA